MSRRIASGQHVFSLIEQILKTSDVQTEVGLWKINLVWEVDECKGIKVIEERVGDSTDSWQCLVKSEEVRLGGRPGSLCMPCQGI